MYNSNVKQACMSGHTLVRSILPSCRDVELAKLVGFIWAVLVIDKQRWTN